MPRHLLARAGQAFNGQTLTSNQIREVVESFDMLGRSPLTFGHPKSESAPKAGEITAVAANDDYTELYGSIKPLEKVAEVVNDGFFDDRSVGIGKAPDGTHYLHHVALLGGVPPAIKGMEPLKDLGVEFSEDDEVMIFDAPDAGSVETLLDRFTNRIKRLLSTEADTTMADDNKTDDQPTIEELQSKIQELEGKLEAKSEEASSESDGEPSDQDFADSPVYQEMKAELERRKQSERESDVKAVRQALEGKVPETVVDEFADLAETLPDVVTFGDDDEEVSPRKQLAEALSKLPLDGLVPDGEYEFSDDAATAADERTKTAQAM